MAGMFKEVTFMCCLATLVLWLTAMLTPGWAIIPGDTYWTDDIQIGLTYYRICYVDVKTCLNRLNQKMVESGEMKEAWTQLQFLGGAAVVLCVFRCIHVNCADFFQSERKSTALFVMVLSALAVPLFSTIMVLCSNLSLDKEVAHHLKLNPLHLKYVLPSLYEVCKEVIEMAKTVPEKLLIVLYGVTIVLWFISMFTQGWLVFNVDDADKRMGSFQTSLFYFKLCDLQGCITKLGTDDDKLSAIDETMPTWTEMQSMSITAVVLCAVCCLLVILPDPCSCKKFKRPIAVILIILNLIAVLIELVLIIRVTVYNATESQNTETTLKKTYKNSNLSVSFKLPYSIVIAGVGWLVGINGCVVGYIHHSSLKKNNRKREGPNQESAASAHTVEHTHPPPHMHHMAYGQPPYGQPPHGKPSYGQPPYGQHSYEQPAHGYTNVHAPQEYYSMPMYTK